MKRILLASAMLAMAAPAFAQTVSSNAGVQANQSTDSGALVGPGKGSVIVGSVAGNYVDVTSTASAQDAGRVRPATTNTNVKTINVGGDLSGGKSSGRNATGYTDATQNTVVNGTAHARAR